MSVTTFTLIILYSIGNVWQEGPSKYMVENIATETACNELGVKMSPNFQGRGGVKFYCTSTTKIVPLMNDSKER